MTKEEYIKRMKEDSEWAPGWDAIDSEFDRIYPGMKPAHYGTNIQARAIFGGDNYLDGYSIYDSRRWTCCAILQGITIKRRITMRRDSVFRGMAHPYI